MAGRDWDKEMAEIDRQLAALPADAPAAASAQRPPVRAPAQPGPTAVTPPTRNASALPSDRSRRPWQATAGLAARLAIGVAALAAVFLWPYPTQCGPELAYYLVAVGVVGIAGLWSAVAAWKHRAPLVHVLSLGLVVASAVFAAGEMLPRVGYAMPVPGETTTWLCPAP